VSITLNENGNQISIDLTKFGFVAFKVSLLTTKPANPICGVFINIQYNLTNVRALT